MQLLIENKSLYLILRFFNINVKPLKINLLLISDFFVFVLYHIENDFRTSYVLLSPNNDLFIYTSVKVNIESADFNTQITKKDKETGQVDEAKWRVGKLEERDGLHNELCIHQTAPVLNCIMQITLLTSPDDFKDSVAHLRKPVILE